MWELNSARDKAFFSPQTLLHLFEGKMQGGSAREEKKERVKEGLPWWCSGQESTCQYRRHRFDL